MNFFKSINFKIIVPPFLLFLIVVVFAVLIGGNFFRNASNKKSESVLNSESKRINIFIKNNLKKSEEVADLYSSMLNLKKNFYRCYKNNKIDSCEMQIKNSLKNIDFKFDYNIDVILPNGNKVFTNNKSFIGNKVEFPFISKVINSREAYTNFENIYNVEYLVSACPIIYNDKVVGIVLLSKPLKKLLNEFCLVEGTDLVLLDKDNRVIYTSNKDNIYDDRMFTKEPKGKYIFYENYIVEKIELKSKDDVFVANTYLLKNIDSENSFIKDLLFYLLLFGVGAFIFGGGIYTWGIYKTILEPVKNINKKIIIVAKGESASETNSKSKDELGQIFNSVDNMIRYRKRTADFANKIGTGELDTDYEVISDKDEIGNALLNMRKALKLAKKEEEKRKSEDEKRNWATKGFAEFGEILRQNNDNIEAFSISILRNLINYTGSNQGGLFIYNDSDENNPVLDLVASYAYNRQKYKEKEIKLGEGLVGTCAIEKEVIYLTDVPDNYVEITSGLGKSNPRNILLVPLKVEDKLFGVIELASFDIYEDYKQEFIIKLGESIASSLSSTKINIMTAQLLEQAQQQQEEMKAQEEELRQNMEEMLATQEESARKEAEMAGLYQAINNNSLVADFDLNGNIIVINDKFAELFGVDKDSFVGVNYNQISSESEGTTNDELWAKIKAGEVVSIKTQVNASTGNKYWLQQTFAPVKNENGDIYKVINISSDITEEREKEIELRQQQEEMKSQEEEMLQNMDEMLAVQEELNIIEKKSKIIMEIIGDDILYAEFTLEGIILDVNDSFLKLFGVESADMFIGQNYLDFSDLSKNKEEKESVVEKLKAGEVVKRKSKITLPDGKEFSFNETFTPVLDEFDKVIRVIDISKLI